MIRRLAILGLVAATMGCGTRSDPPQSLSGGAGLDPSSPNLVYATTWDSLKITANFAVTTLDSTAHFTTTRNACGKRADGVLAIQDWDSFATAMNAAAAAPVLETEKCVDISNRDYQTFKFDGTAELVFSNHTSREIMTVRGSQICHTIGDEQAAAQLIDKVNQIVLRADKEACPNGWGSA